jgi:hypothetical protein
MNFEEKFVSAEIGRVGPEDELLFLGKSCPTLPIELEAELAQGGLDPGAVPGMDEEIDIRERAEGEILVNGPGQPDALGERKPEAAAGEFTDKRSEGRSETEIAGRVAVVEALELFEGFARDAVLLFFKGPISQNGDAVSDGAPDQAGPIKRLAQQSA